MKGSAIFSEPITVDKVCGNAVRVNYKNWWNISRSVKVSGTLNQIPTCGRSDVSSSPSSSIPATVGPRRSSRMRTVPVRYR